MVYLDLSELDTVFHGRWLWSTSRPSVAWFRRSDHVGDPSVPLDESVRALVEQRTGRRPMGPIRLLTHLRYWSYIFNPVSFYYCFDISGTRLEAMVADVSNTPWAERYQYVLAVPDSTEPRVSLNKAFHVSPFMPLDIEYDWRFTLPAEWLSVHMASAHQGTGVFDATLTLQRRPIGTWSLARVLVRHPAMTLVVVASIYWQAYRLWRKRTPFYHHPRHGQTARPEAPHTTSTSA
jgi:DUF1365 family protein